MNYFKNYLIPVSLLRLHIAEEKALNLKFAKKISIKWKVSTKNISIMITKVYIL